MRMPTVTMLPLMSKRPTSLMARRRFARRLRSGLFQRRGCEAAGEIAFERHEVRRQRRVERRLRRLVVGDELERAIPGKRHDLRDDDAFALGAELPGECIGADEGDVDEGRIRAAAVCELDELGAGTVGPDHDDGLGFGALDHPPGRGDGAGVALEGAFGGELEAAPGKRALHADKSIAAEGIILIEDADAGEPAVLGEVLDPCLGLRAVARADVDDVWKLEVAQELGAGERTDERDFPGAGDRYRRHRGRRADRADQREHLVVLEQLQRLRHGTIGVIAVVAADELELAAMDAALAVDLGERRDDALPHALPERRGGAFECGHLAEQDRIVADADLIAFRRQHGRGQQCDGQGEVCRGARSCHVDACRMLDALGKR
ncbi:hypothetical protein ACVIWV_000847 [Bradyrhizobium diazoefficiens]